MKRIILIIIGVAFILHTYAQTNGIPKQSLPTNSANYRLTIDIKERDLDGIFRRQIIYNGKIAELSWISTIDNTFQLKNVNRTVIIGEQEPYTRTFDELERLNFKILGDNFTHINFYKDVPPEQVELVRTFIQDKVTFETWGLMYLDSLVLNTPFYPDLFQNQQAEFEQSVSFNTQKLNITWLGYSRINEKNCILVCFKSMYSPFLVDNNEVTLNGRSCFWGNIWILPDTRQIEYAIMNEDVVTHLKSKNNDFEQQLNSQREVIYEKIE